MKISGWVENRLLPGRYFVKSWIVRDRLEGDMAMHVLQLLEFYVYGTQRGAGNVMVDADVHVELLEDEDS